VGGVGHGVELREWRLTALCTRMCWKKICRYDREKQHKQAMHREESSDPLIAVEEAEEATNLSEQILQ